MTRPSISVPPPPRLGRFRVGKQEAEPPGATPTDLDQPRSLADMPVRAIRVRQYEGRRLAERVPRSTAVAVVAGLTERAHRGRP